MAIGVIFDGQFTQAQYEQVLNEVCPDGAMSPGMQYHAAGATENGWCVFEVWESREAADRFFNERLGRAIQKANISVQPNFFDVHNIMQP
jgi:quinol monooxygenase YgiN